MALHDGAIAEMKTGEGKTLTSTLAAYLNALEAKAYNGVRYLWFVFLFEASVGFYLFFEFSKVFCLQSSSLKEVNFSSNWFTL